MKSFRHRSKLDPYTDEIQSWKNSGLSDRDIAAKLWQIHRIKVSYRTINHFLHTHTDHKEPGNAPPPPADIPTGENATPATGNTGEQARPPAIQETLPLPPAATTGNAQPQPQAAPDPSPVSPAPASSPETQAALGYLHAELNDLKQKTERQQSRIEQQQRDLLQATQALRDGQTALRETLTALEAAQEATQRAIEERSGRPELLTPEILPPLAWRRNLPEPWLTSSSAPAKRRRLLAWLLQYVLPMLLTIGLLLAALSGHLTLSMFCPTNLPARLSLWGEQTLGLIYGWLIKTPILLLAILGGLALAARSRLLALGVLVLLLIHITGTSRPRTGYFRQPGAYPGNRPAPQTPFLKPERCPRFPLARNLPPPSTESAPPWRGSRLAVGESWGVILQKAEAGTPPLRPAPPLRGSG